MILYITLAATQALHSIVERNIMNDLAETCHKNGTSIEEEQNHKVKGGREQPLLYISVVKLKTKSQI